MAVPEQHESIEVQLGLLDDAENLLGAFLRAVSHDLKTPLLTLSLSTELLGDVFPDDERGRVAREAMTHGIQEMDRMLEAVTLVSRARRRALSDRATPLGEVLSGHIVISEALEPARTLVAVDARSVREALLALGPAPIEVRLEGADGSVRLSAALPEAAADVEGSCVQALLASLTQYSGTPVAGLAAAEVLLLRQGGTVRCLGGRAVIDLPAESAGERA